MTKILALDIGTNSIGYTIREPEVGQPIVEQLVDYGATIFPKGVGNSQKGEFSFASERTKSRSTRRLYQVRKYRLWETLKVLVKTGYCPLTEDELQRWRHYDKNNEQKRVYPISSQAFESWIKLDFNNDLKPDYSTPYHLREELATVQLNFESQENRYKLGRAIYHIAQRRGFRSSKGETVKEKQGEDIQQETTLKMSEQAKMLKITTYIDSQKEIGVEFPTLGCVLAHIASSGERVRKEYQVIRSEYEKEVRYLFHFQNGLVAKDDLLEDIIKAIFFVRPLRSQKGLVGRCTLEPKKYRSPQGHVEFEEFRAWSLINNIQVRQDDASNWQTLNIADKRQLFDNRFMLQRAHFKFEEIRLWIEKNTCYKQLSSKGKTINYDDKTSVSGCPVSARFKNVFGDEWRSLEIRNEDKTYGIEDIWHILFSTDNHEWMDEFFKINLGLDERQRNGLLKLQASMPVGYSQLSKKAIVNINRFLKKGLIYTDAVLMAKLPDIFGDKWNTAIENSIHTQLRDLIVQNRNKKRIYTMANSLISAYHILPDEHKFGYKNTDYRLDKDDLCQVEKHVVDFFGEKSWNGQPAEFREVVKGEVTRLYQGFFADYKRRYYVLPKLEDGIKGFMTENFDVSDDKLNKLYHPSQIEFYEPAKYNEEYGMVLLGSPKIGAFKNPVAMRALYQLRQLVNYLLTEKLIDEDTRIVVEMARDMNDANMRRAIELYQNDRETENKKIIDVLKEYYHNPHYESNDDEVDKLRLWLEQWDIPEKGDKDKIAARKTNKKAEFQKIEKLIDKITLWKEQQFRCIYTGKLISMHDILSENNIVEIEHTIPRSLFPDNSLANKTICFYDYNRYEKQNRIPTSLRNYDEILLRLQPWQERIDKLKENLIYWSNKSKNTVDKEEKNKAIVEKHRRKMELDYWSAKVERFTVTEINSGFRNSQLVDTRIISKYAMHFLRSLFTRVEVQKGSVTSDFRKILGIQNEGEKKDRSLHSHHTIDAVVLSLIPKSASRDRILELYYKIEEERKLHRDVSHLTQDFQRELKLNNIGSVQGIVRMIEQNLIVNNVSIDRVLTPAHKIERKRGRGKELTGRILTGDCIRGQLHEASFYGAIRPAMQDEAGKLVRDKHGYVQQDENVYVIRRELKFKKNTNESGFANLDELLSAIVDKNVGEMIKKQVVQAYSLGVQMGDEKEDINEMLSTIEACKNAIKENNKLKKEGRKSLVEEGKIVVKYEKIINKYFAAVLDGGVYMYNKKMELVTHDRNGKKLNPIRHVRCIATSIKNPLTIKNQTYKSTKEYKNHYYASVGDVYAICRYVSETGRPEYKTYNLFEITENRRYFGEPFCLQIQKKGEVFELNKIIKAGIRILIHSENVSELRGLSDAELSKRLYVVKRFEAPSTVILHHHLCANPQSRGKGIDYDSLDTPQQIYRCSINTVNCLFENDDFSITSNGRIDFK